MEVGDKVINALMHFNIDLSVNISPALNGVNSDVYIIDEKYILKFYRKDNNLPSRLDRESYALKLFEIYNVDNVPKLLSVSKDHNCILMTFLHGSVVQEFNVEYYQQFTLFYNRILEISKKERLNSFSSIDSCPTLITLYQQLNSRILNLTNEKNLILTPIIYKLNNYIDFLSSKIKPNYFDNLRTELSVVDFGLNNILINNSKVFFIDFEFFGLDNPVHLISDTIAHPANNLSIDQQIELSKNLINCHENINEVINAFNGTNILFDIKWCLIMLNPFLKSYALNINEDEREKRKSKQLDKVELKIKLIEEKINNEYFLSR